jgi:protein-S-isoprenylcysteine O-methyltransferase Ste14
MKTGLRAHGPIVVASVAIAVQYFLAFFVFRPAGAPVLQWIGWGIWLLSVYLGIAPILVLRHGGGVAPGKTYVHTTRLVDTNIYGIVRHPQYLAGICLNLAMMLLAQHWLIAVLGIVSITMLALDAREADRQGIEKFGTSYRHYMQRVPRINILLGLWRRIRDRDSNYGRDSS